ncbi:hypothetical protein YC2023_016216 [Brassica napus]
MSVEGVCLFFPRKKYGFRLFKVHYVICVAQAPTNPYLDPPTRHLLFLYDMITTLNSHWFDRFCFSVMVNINNAAVVFWESERYETVTLRAFKDLRKEINHLDSAIILYSFISMPQKPLLSTSRIGATLTTANTCENHFSFTHFNLLEILIKKTPLMERVWLT